MAQAIARLCGRGHRFTGKRCRECERANDRQRGSAHQRGYTREWRGYAANWLRRFPLCGMRLDGLRHAEHSACTREGRLVAAECVDHIKAVSQGGDFWDPYNHQSLCLNCNRRKAIEHEGGLGRS